MYSEIRIGSVEFCVRHSARSTSVRAAPLGRARTGTGEILAYHRQARTLKRPGEQSSGVTFPSAS